MAKLSNNNFFIEIENTSLSPISIDAMIKTRRNQEKNITPELALDILRYTNHLGNIKPILKEIQKLPLEEQLKYKEFVLSAISHRMCSQEVTNILVKLALDGDYIQEFMDTNSHTKLYFPQTCKAINIHHRSKSNEDFSSYDTLISRSNYNYRPSIEIEKCILPSYISLPNCSKISLTNNNYDNVKEMCFSSVEEISFNHQSVSQFPDKIDLSSCRKATFFYSNLSGLKSIKVPNNMILEITGCCYLPEIMHLNDLSTVDIHSAFNTTKELIVENTNVVSLDSSTRLPKKITIKNSKRVCLNAIDFDIEELNLENITAISLCSKREQRGDSKENPPETLDLSTCQTITFQNFPLGKIKELKFGDFHPVVDLQYAKSMPKVLDLSGVKRVNLDCANFQGLEKIIFAKNSRISLTKTFNLPKKLDISMCEYVDMFNCDLTGVEEITFLNSEQKNTLLEKNQTFSGKIKYTASTITQIKETSHIEM